MSSESVPVNELASILEDKARISTEFRELQGQLEKCLGSGKNVCTSALEPANTSANRYMNVLALEKTRVTLSLSSGWSKSDYINANYVDGLVPHSEQAYIATQGPLEGTEDAFWRMIWDAKASVIVMLTRLLENGRTKCHHYWPTRKDGYKKTYGSVEVLISSALELDKSGRREGLVLRKAYLKKGNETRRMYHFQLLAWPDAGVPASTTEVLHLIEEVNRTNSPRSPIVVHCSAGIGRTGTFVLVHAVLARVERKLRKRPDEVPSVNMFKSLSKLRTQKPMLVQTAEQYEFCYRCVADGVARLKAKEQAV
eukprot:TRINITY_DN28015_c0_g1_i1.p1 TRINITY_DN28015_c0_g1~~TRINITY_DN28015_c0_g1_i1.p1  ORF type:complete len:311 (-),score=95.10 TRINITY_DN28015_c0_g1_i1:307-1239(-)